MNNYKITITRFLSIIIGTLLIAIATNAIIIPNHLLSGGISGIALLLHFLFNFKVSLLVILFNIPLLILGLLYLQKTYLAYSLFGMLMLSFWLELTSNFVIATNNTLSILLIGGLFQGVGTALVFKYDGSTGGTDIISKIIQKHFSVNMATTNFAINLVIISLSIYFFDIDMATLTIGMMYVASKITNFVVDGLNRKRTLYIITDKAHYNTLSQTLLAELNRGVTMIPAIGAYTHDEKYILFTTVSMREVAKAKQIVLSVDPKAFMTITETSQAIGNGRGFTELQNSI